jgi:hypothetical protein
MQWNLFRVNRAVSFSRINALFTFVTLHVPTTTHVFDIAVFFTLCWLKVFASVITPVIYPKKHSFATIVGTQRMRDVRIRLIALDNLIVKLFVTPSVHF